MSSINTKINKTTSTKSFLCPVGHCGQRIDENSRQIADHIRKGHPVIAKNLGIVGNPGKRTYICYPCNSYTVKVHHHCFECENPNLPGEGKLRYFSTAEERDEHLKKDHSKWWFEYECKFGTECRGKKGGCGFNHNLFEQPFISDITDIPASICRYDRPWDGQRCLRDKCSFSHFWGRVRFLIKSRATKGDNESSCGDCDSRCQNHLTSDNAAIVEETEA